MNHEPQPVNCFVAIFDILGFKAIRKSIGTAELYKKYTKSTRPLIQHAAAGARKLVERNGEKVFVPATNILSCSYAVFSDTVLFSSRDDSLVSFLAVLQASRELLSSGFASNTAYRGAIGYGDVIIGEGVFVGSAIEDAYLGEQMQTWAGCMLTENCKKFIETNKYLSLFKENLIAYADTLDEANRQRAQRSINDIFLYEVPISRNPRDSEAIYGTLQTYAVNWTQNVFADAGQQAFRPSEDSYVKRIIENTVTFEKWAREQI